MTYQQFLLMTPPAKRQALLDLQQQARRGELSARCLLHEIDLRREHPNGIANLKIKSASTPRVTNPTRPYFSGSSSSAGWE